MGPRGVSRPVVLSRRFGIKPVGSGKEPGTEEGAILSQHGMIPKSG
jgi:hypothetical protein